jgi:ferredoxin
MEENDKEVVIGKCRVKVIRSQCIGDSTCTAMAPTAFRIDEEKKSVPLETGTESAEKLLMAAQACPGKAIVITDNETGKQIWPS